MKQENGTELEFARKMLLNEHARWNQWALFFLGGLITIITASDKMFDRYEWWVTPSLTLILSILWVFSALAIIKSTWSWVETIKELEATQETKTGWKIFEESKAKWVMGDEIKGTFFFSSQMNPRIRDRILKVTYNLVRIGYVIIIISICMIAVTLFRSNNTEFEKCKKEVDSLNIENELLKTKDGVFSNLVQGVSIESEKTKLENHKLKNEVDSLQKEYGLLKNPIQSKNGIPKP